MKSGNRNWRYKTLKNENYNKLLQKISDVSRNDVWKAMRMEMKTDFSEKPAAAAVSVDNVTAWGQTFHLVSVDLEKSVDDGGIG